MCHFLLYNGLWINVPLGSFDSTDTDLKVSAALLPFLLGGDRRLKYVDDNSRISKTTSKAFLERLSPNINAMLATRNKDFISNEQPMTRGIFTFGKTVFTTRMPSAILTTLLA